MDPSTSAHLELFEYEAPTREVIEGFLNITPATSWANRKAEGQYLDWACGTFTIGKKATPSEKVYVAWHDKDGNQLNVDRKRMPAVEIECPPAPIKSIYITPESILKYADDIGRANQKIEFDRECVSDLYPEWQECVKDLDELFVDKLVRFLVKNADSHSLLNDSDRDVIRDEGEEEAIKVLTRIMRNSHDHSHHQLRWWVPKRNIFRVNYSDGPVKKICPHDEWIKDREEWQRMADHLLSVTEPHRLNLIRVLLPDGTTAVKPDEYNLLHHENAVGALTLTVYGVHRRPDGQHSTMAANTCVQLITNGVPSTGGATGVDVMAIRKAKRARIEDE